MAEQFQPVQINFASVRIVGIPGLTLVFIAWAIAVEFPEARWLALRGLAGGILIALAMIIRRRRRPQPLSGRRTLLPRA